jgi:exosortase E/protease (VPEID-CTERM system)
MPQLGLVALLVAELVYLTVRFDSQALDRASSPWLHLVAWSPQYLRLAITVAVTALVLKTWRLAGPSAARAPASPSARIAWLAVHVAALLLFVRTTATVFDPALADRNAGMWVAAWFVLGAATLAAWALALWPRRISWLESKSVRAFAGVAAALGGAACLSGYVAEALWQPLARTTFSVVGAMLGVIYPQVVSQPEHLRLGTPGFAVRIAPECSGYEGIGLLLAFLAIYLWVYRRELRFPTALVLLPIGAVVMWVVNALRIVALIAIGTAGWRNIALGGFHSQAGWIAFNAIALSFVVLLNRGGYFRTEAAVSAAAHQDDATPAYLVPFLVVVACAMITGAFSAGIDWLYPVRVVAAAWMLWLFRRSYAHLGWTISWRAIAIGCVTFAIWIALVPSGPAGEPLPAALQSVPFAWAAAWLALRIVGYTVTVPLVEELAFRGYLTRRLMRSDFEHLPLGLFSWWSFVVSSLLFGALHGGLWLAGTIAGMTFALALYQRRAIGDAVVAHATTNGLIAMYVLTTGRWSMWG